MLQAYCWCLIACCVFSGSLTRLRKTEWALQPGAFLDQRLDRIKWFPLLNWELLLPSVKLTLKPRLLFLAMFASGRNFRRFNGTWAIVHSLLYGTVPSFPQKKELRDLSNVNSNQDCSVYVTINVTFASNMFQIKDWIGCWDELDCEWFISQIHEFTCKFLYWMPALALVKLFKLTYYFMENLVNHIKSNILMM